MGANSSRRSCRPKFRRARPASQRGAVSTGPGLPRPQPQTGSPALPCAPATPHRTPWAPQARWARIRHVVGSQPYTHAPSVQFPSPFHTCQVPGGSLTPYSRHLGGLPLDPRLPSCPAGPPGCRHSWDRPPGARGGPPLCRARLRGGRAPEAEPTGTSLPAWDLEAHRGSGLRHGEMKVLSSGGKCCEN